MTAVLLCGSHHHCARQGRCAASTVATVRTFARNKLLMISPKPSPPSVIGSNLRVSRGRLLRQPRAIASAACHAVSVPLNLSGMIRTFSNMPVYQGGNAKPQPENRRKERVAKTARYGSVRPDFNL